MTSGNLPAQHDCKPIQFCKFTAAQVLHNPSSYSKWGFPVVIGLGNKTALSIILRESVISRPNRNVQICLYYERIYAKPQSAGR